MFGRTATPGAVPTEVRTDADRRALYNSNGAPSRSGYAVPDATPNRVRLGEQAADINREKRVENISDELSEGDIVRVKVLEVDKQGRIRLSIKACNEGAKPEAAAAPAAE